MDAAEIGIAIVQGLRQFAENAIGSPSASRAAMASETASPTFPTWSPGLVTTGAWPVWVTVQSNAAVPVCPAPSSAHTRTWKVPRADALTAPPITPE